jgi:hypothetical protein
MIVLFGADTPGVYRLCVLLVGKKMPVSYRHFLLLVRNVRNNLFHDFFLHNGHYTTVLSAS